MDHSYKLLFVSIMLLIVQCSNGYLFYRLLTRLPNENMTLLAVMLGVNIYLIIVACVITLSEVKRGCNNV